MKLFLITAGIERYLVLAESREMALDAMRGYGSSHLSCREVPPNVKLPVVAKVLTFAR